jgi:hypothetical protein
LEAVFGASVGALGRLNIFWSSKRGRKRAVPGRLFVANMKLFHGRFDFDANFRPPERTVML